MEPGWVASMVEYWAVLKVAGSGLVQYMGPYWVLEMAGCLVEKKEYWREQY